MTDPKRSRWWLLAIPVGLVAALLIAVVAIQLRSGVRVSVKNTGATPLKTVVLQVTGANCNLGDIPPGGTAWGTVHPIGESHLEIEFTDPDGQPYRLDAGGYFEPGYRGTIDISIKGGVIEKNEQRIGLPWSLPYARRR